MALPASDYARDVMIAEELAARQAPPPSITDQILTTLGFSYGNDAYIESEKSRILADLRGEPEGSWLTAQPKLTDETRKMLADAGVNVSAIEAVLARHPEVAESIEEAVQRPTPDVPIAYTVERIASSVGETVGTGLSSALAGSRGILTLVVVGIIGLAVFAVAK